MKTYYVYIMTDRSKSFYIGFTGKLRQRVFEHKNGIKSDFTSKYKLDRLVYFERYTHPLTGIAREKELKGWTRLKKMQLIVASNPEWKDLSEGWFEKA